MTQIETGQSSREIPPVVYKLGNSPLSIHYGRKKARWLNVISLLIVAALTGLGGIYLIVSGQQPGAGFLGIPIALGCLIYGIYEWYRTLAEKDLCVFVMKDGFVLSKGGRQTIFRWADIIAVWESATEVRQNNIKLKTVFRYTVQQRDGQKCILTDTLEEIEKLGTTIQKEVTPRLLSQVFDQLNSGHVVNFGKVAVSKSGIILSKNTTPWKQIKKIDCSDGFIAISRIGKSLNWVVKVADIPNVHVFLTLVNQVMEKMSQKTTQVITSGMVLESEKTQPIPNASENDITRIFGDDKSRGNFVTLSISKQFYVQAAGEGNGPYTLECRIRDNEHHYRCPQTLTKQAVQAAFLKYLHRDPTFSSDFVWEKIKI